MKKCTVCTAENPDGARRCRSCGESTFFLPRPARGQFQNLSRKLRLDRSVRLAVAGFCACLVAVFGATVWRWLELNELRSQLAAERAHLEMARAATITAQNQAEARQIAAEAGRQWALRQDPDFLSGALARRNHTEEWRRRLAHDPQLATTILERNLLTMADLGQDTTLADQTVLERVATLAAPEGSRVEVTPDGDEFRVRVAFMMSRLSRNEAGANTKHHSTSAMREEIQELSARVMRDLYSYCGTRGIRAISVTCDHTLVLMPTGATPEEQTLLWQRLRPVISRLYRVSLDQTRARAVTDWPAEKLSQVAQLSTVEYDGFNQLTIRSGHQANADTQDASGELSF